MKLQGQAGRLAEEEVKAILDTIREVTDGRNVTGICVYGSRVAGYAREDSDYDLLIVLERYKPKVRYGYLEGKVAVSALIVDKESMMADAERASLGEFVIGRLLNIYEALRGEGYLRDVERRYKRRVVAEALKEIIGSYGDFSTEFIIPVDYFLFERLKRRATIYPPAIYSYSKAYSGSLRDANLQATRRGFLEALAELEEEGLVSLEDGRVRVKRAPLAGSQLATLSAMVTYTARGLKQYAVHGYAGRVGLEIIGKEVLSKMGRSKGAVELPEEIQHPKNLWGIDGGLLIMEGNWLELTAKSLGLRRPFKVVQRQLGELYNISKVYILDDGTKKASLVIKKFRDAMSVKWALINVWALPTKKFDVSPLARLHREYLAIRALRHLGFNTPKVVSISLKDRVLVTEFVEGTDLGKVVADILRGRPDYAHAISLYGEVLGLIHGRGYCVGDTKPENAVLSDGRIFLTDLEQAGTDGDKAWDVAEFIYYSTKLSLNVKAAESIADSFLIGYLKHGEVETVRKALSLKYMAPFQPFLLPQVATAVREVMSKKAGRDGQRGYNLS